MVYLLIDGLDFYPCMLLGDNWKLDPDVAAFPSPKEALLSKITLSGLFTWPQFYLIDHRECGAICAVPLDDNNETPQHGGYYLMCL